MIFIGIELLDVYVGFTFLFFKMCQTDPAIPGTTYPCAATVADFKVESDGTTTIMYKEVPDYIAYERYVSRFAIHL